MPATEQTWRNLKSLHVVFGVSALALLLTTVWLLAADHHREAKSLQKTFNVIESRHLSWRKSEQQTAEFAKTRQTLEDALLTARSKRPADAERIVAGFVRAAETKPENGYDLESVKQASQAWADAEAKTPEEKLPLRNRLIGAMQRVVDKATFVENEAQRKLKFTKADLDVDVSKLAIEIDEGKPAREVAKTERQVTEVRGKVENDLTLAYQAAKTHRLALQGELAALRQPELDAQKEADKHDAEVARIEAAIAEKSPNVGKWFLELPILDAFGGPLKPQQVWLPDLPWNNNFRNVARFDRCVTCHLGIDKTAPGSAVAPAYEQAHPLTIALETPKIEPAVEEYAKPLNQRLQKLYGFTLAERGLLNPDDVTVEAVFTGGAAVFAGLRAGDVIERVGGVKLLGLEAADNYLAKTVAWGKPLQLTVRRGMPQPYASHPRLDLFVGSLSPHKVGEFGCTICHEGQGNATAFKWASHTPNDPEQSDRWAREQGWFNNHHWIYPMLPARFQEANCLKCHHEVTELKPSAKFPDPPAPKLVAGFETIQDVGCFGCHEINGYDGPKKRRGPDLRAEPNFFAAAAQVLADPKLQGSNLTGEPARIAELAREAVAHPQRTNVRKQLAERIVADARAVADGKPASVLGASTHAMAGILGSDEETPGKYNKVGPSLRYVASKNDSAFLYDWVRDPTNFRPTTKMPKFFGLHDHLVDVEKVDEQGNVVLDKQGKPVKVKSRGRADAERFEPIEISAINAYLLSQSQPFSYIDPPKTAADGKTIDAANVDRGRGAFQTRGCLACHGHNDFPEIKQRQGPDLSGLGAKLTGEKGRRWLYSWLKQPNAYHARTVMPNMLLEPFTETLYGPDGKSTGTLTVDPAADIAAFLLTKTLVDPGNGKPAAEWKPQAEPAIKAEDLDELLKMYLSGAFTRSETDRIVKSGVPAELRSGVKGDERMLVVDGPLSQEVKLAYLGKKTISRLGCSGCHDIPGFEDSKPIGTGLADWGRKEPSKLAFEQILRYLTEKDGHGGHGHGGHGAEVGPPDLDKGFFMDALGHHQREGFLWQKLREPRSYDYMKTEFKSYIDRLRMPKFNLDDAQREQIMTFVLGLVAEPPPAKYVYAPNPRQEAILAGQRVIEKFNCAGCHALQMERWEIQYKPGKMQAPPLADEYAFLIPHFSPAEVEQSKKTDRRGLGTAHIHGVPQPKEDEEEPTVYFKLWSPTLIDGQTWLSGGVDVAIDEKFNPPGSPQRRKQVGGVFADYVYPVNLANEKKANPGINTASVWGFGPPPLVGQGRKVQPQWFHDFLLDPFPIRPAAVLRMPKFHLTSDEAKAVVDYFAAADGAEFPYEFDPRTRNDYLSSKEMQYRVANNATGDAAPDKRLNDALALVTDQQFCIKCHKLGDFVPAGRNAGIAPNLAFIHDRLRPEYLRDWLANPARILPYTAMPVNFPKNQVVGQHRFKGTSEQQVEAIADLLLNYEQLMSQKTLIAPLIAPAPAPGGAAPAAPGAPAAPAATPAVTSPPPAAAPTGTKPAASPTPAAPPGAATPAPAAGTNTPPGVTTPNAAKP